ncbi:Unknown protein, partial [Striga hermonthica]
RGLRWVKDGWWIPADDCVRLKGWDPWPEPTETSGNGKDNNDRLMGEWRASAHDARGWTEQATHGNATRGQDEGVDWDALAFGSTSTGARREYEERASGAREYVPDENSSTRTAAGVRGYEQAAETAGMRRTCGGDEDARGETSGGAKRAMARDWQAGTRDLVRAGLGEARGTHARDDGSSDGERAMERECTTGASILCAEGLGDSREGTHALDDGGTDGDRISA